MAPPSSTYRLECVDEEIALSYDNQPVVTGDEIEGIVTFGDDWVNFYFQSCSSAEIMGDLSLNMNDLYNTINFPSITETPAFVNGAPCAARYSKDNRWYRARLLDISYSVVFFVDYGNKQMTNLENVKPLTRTLAELVPPLAFQCTLINFQNPLLPSFVEGSDIIKVTIHSKHEPYEVSVRVMSQQQNGAQNTTGSQNARQNGFNGNGSNTFENGNRRQQPGRQSQNQPRTTQGLTLPTVRSSSKFMSDEEEDDIERMKNQNKRTRVVTTGGILSVTGAAGTITQLYATCGQITPPEGPYKSNVFQFNSQETTFNNGVLTVENLCRIFRTGDRMICSARFEDPLPNGMTAKNSKHAKPPNGYYQVTDMQMVSSNRLLISHAIVTFVSNEGIGLYIRNRQESVFAPISSFPDKKPDVSISEFVELGRSVMVRSLPAEHFPDIQVTAEWVAHSVEFLGIVVESQGWMYFVRENYSVLITDGGIGFGYVFVQNQFVESAGIQQSMWYGTRAIFRACIDVPDKENFRFGTRWKALSVRMLPEHSKGPYRYPGIYRPPPTPSTDLVAAKKLLDDDVDDNFDLPEEALEEMRRMGQDSIGIDRLQNPTKPRAVLSEVADNLLNEQEELTLNGENCVIEAAKMPTNDGKNQLPERVPPLSASKDLLTRNNAFTSINNNDNIIMAKGLNLLEDAAHGMQKPRYNPDAPDPGIDDLLGLSLNDEPGPSSAASKRVISSGSVPKRMSPSEELLALWEGSANTNTTIAISTIKENSKAQNNQCRENGITSTTSPNSFTASVPSNKKISITNGVGPQHSPRVETVLVVEPRTRDQGCQPSEEDQLMEEIRVLRQSPDLLSKVVAHIATLSADVQKKFYALLAHTAD